MSADRGDRGGRPDHEAAHAGTAGADEEGRLAGCLRDLGAIRTDLAVEAHQYLTRHHQRPDGVDVDEEDRGPVHIARVHIRSAEAGRRMGKQPGRYVTLDAPELRKRNTTLQEQLGRVLAEEIQRLAPIHDGTKVFVVGLGNWNATPDALGPKVVDRLLVTRHLEEVVPADLRGGLRSLCALTPGVLGLTGIETTEIISSIVERLQPDLVIAVDALASRSLDRILTSVQIADTGLHPGSGVGNHRRGLNRETLGVPVLAIGVPTVVHAFTIANDTLEKLAERLQGRNGLAAYLQDMNAEEKHELIQAVLRPANGDLMVTPKEIDVLVDDLSRIIAGGINAAVHPRFARLQSIL